MLISPWKHQVEVRKHSFPKKQQQEESRDPMTDVQMTSL